MANYVIFDRDATAVDKILGTTGAKNNYLEKIVIRETVATSAINIYDGTVASGTLVYTIDIGATKGTTLDLGLKCNTNWTIENDADNAGQLLAIGEFN